MNKYLLYLIGLASGILLGVFFCNFSYFVFEKTIKITDIISIAATSFFGYYIATRVTKGLNKNTSEKELIIEEVKSTLKTVNIVLESISNRNIPFRNAVKSFKSINERINLIETLLNSSHCKGITVSHISDNLKSLRKSVTSISPVNGIINFNSVNYNLIHSSTISLKSKFYNLIFEINKT